MQLRRQKEKYQDWCGFLRETVVKTNSGFLFALHHFDALLSRCLSCKRLAAGQKTTIPFVLREQFQIYSILRAGWKWRHCDSKNHPQLLILSYSYSFHFSSLSGKRWTGSGLYILFRTPCINPQTSRRSTKRCGATMVTLQVKWKPWHKPSVPWTCWGLTVPWGRWKKGPLVVFFCSIEVVCIYIYIIYRYDDMVRYVCHRLLILVLVFFCIFSWEKVSCADCNLEEDSVLWRSMDTLDSLSTKPTLELGTQKPERSRTAGNGWISLAWV